MQLYKGLLFYENFSYYIKSIVDSKAKREELGLNDVGYIFDLIKATNDPAYIKGKVDSYCLAKDVAKNHAIIIFT